MLITKSVKDENQFGQWKDGTPSSVVGSAYDTSGNGGRKLVKLDDGTLVAVAKDTAAKGYRIYKSADGITWTAVISNISYTSFSDVAICAVGNTIGTLFNYSDVGIQFELYNLDGTRVQPAKIVDSVQTAMGNVSLCIDGTGALHAAWSSKNSTYPNSFNIRYSKSTDGVTWSGPTQVTANTATSLDTTNPSIIVQSSGFPSIICQFQNQNQIEVGNFNGTSWSFVSIYQGNTYSQSNPCAVVDSNDVIHVAWQGADSGLGTHRLRYSKSSDGGTAWTAMVLVDSATDGVAQPSLTIGNNGKLYVYAQQTIGSNPYQLIQYTNDGTGWSAKTTVTSFTMTGKNVFPQTSLPNSDGVVRLIYMDGTGSTVQYDASPRPKVPDTTPSIIETYIPLWMADGGAMNTTATAGSACVKDGGGTDPRNATATNQRLFTLSSNWPADQKFCFQATFYNNGSTAYCTLWDMTTDTQVIASAVTLASSTVANVVRSGTFTLTPGHSYGISFWGGGGTTYFIDASLVAFG